MIFSLAILGAPYSSAAAETACRFATAALADGHHIHRLFFYHDGVHNASSLAAMPADESDLTERWRELIRTHRLDAVVCIAAAQRRGILDSGSAERLGKCAANLAPDFVLGGLGQLIEAVVRSDRLLTFGS